MIKKILVLFLTTISTITFAQRTNSSPYSFFGVGQQTNRVTVEQASMGGIGTALSDEKYLNFTNPAAFSKLRFTTFSLGALSSNLTLNNGVSKQSSSATSLSYVSLGFPVSSKAGVAFGLQPNSSVGYSLLTSIKDGNGDVVEAIRFYGTGGTNRLFGAFGIQVSKNLSVGLEGDFIFGTIENNILSSRLNVLLASKNNEELIVRGGSIKLGAQYSKKMKNDLDLNLGATFKLENGLNLTGNEHLYSLIVAANGIENPVDTLSSASKKGELINPLKTNLGISLSKKNKWHIETNYEFQSALTTNNNILNISSTNYKYGNSNKFQLGGYYIPKINSISSYWDRVVYRAGLRFENTGLLVNGTGVVNDFTNIKDFGISFGVGLPMTNRVSSLNMGFEYGQRGTTANNLIKENYFNFRLSLSLNSSWFVKRKID